MMQHFYTGPLPPKRFNMAAFCLAPAGNRDPAKTALTIDHGSGAPDRWTYGALDSAVQGIAAGLAQMGLSKGDRVMIRMGNTPDAALMFFGAIAGGFVPVPTSAMLTTHEAAFVLNDSSAAVLALSDDLPMDDTGTARVLMPGEIAALAKTTSRGYADTHKDDPAFLVYTSGTSGTPKGVLHAHRSVWGRKPMVEGWYGLTRDDVMVHAGAVNWTYTLGVGLSDPWAAGASTVLYNGPKNINAWPRLIREHNGTLFAAVPSLYRQILRDSDVSAGIPTLRHGLTAGEPLPARVASDWQAITGLPLYEALGMSECSTYISSGPTTPVRSGSPGRPQPGRCVAVLPTDECAPPEPLPAGETGLLAIHTSDPALMLRYWNRPEEDARVIRGDWFCGGDLACMDADGYVWFEGRADDVMNAQGYRVSPAEVEAALTSHPAVAQVAVREVETASGVHIIAAFVKPAGAAPDPSLLIAHARQHLAAYKCPRQILFVDDLPHTPNGKLARKRLPARI
ncbi:AMP-binding protein [Pyruvatibacter sp.]|uniref:acyl-CoA synthetase n=1 Tax=Pyruvatibacter sp. TaxID=1981328 RepID=UPI0032EDB692